MRGILPEFSYSSTPRSLQLPPDYIATREVAKERVGPANADSASERVIRIHFEHFKEKVETSGQQAGRSRIDNMSVS